MTLNFSEILTPSKFEDLVVAHFEELRKENGSNIVDINIKPSGEGVDGGRDILLNFQVSDSLSSFKRTWVVQCKFRTSNVSPSAINNINIPTLLYSYQASGYLLVCKQKPTSKLTDLFERLETNCPLGNKFTIWSGEQFKRLLLTKSNPTILKQFFPKYYAYCIKNKILKP